MSVRTQKSHGRTRVLRPTLRIPYRGSGRPRSSRPTRSEGPREADPEDAQCRAGHADRREQALGRPEGYGRRVRSQKPSLRSAVRRCVAARRVPRLLRPALRPVPSRDRTKEERHRLRVAGARPGCSGDEPSVVDDEPLPPNQGASGPRKRRENARRGRTPGHG